MRGGAGKLNKRVTIQEQGSGADYTTYTDCTNGHVWASIEPLTSRERWEAQAIDPKITHRVRMRYWPKLTSAHRLKWGKRTLELKGDPINVNEANVEYELMCCEGKADGE
jgi:SPP1 family predicted phage head-tail adaptor